MEGSSTAIRASGWQIAWGNLKGYIRRDVTSHSDPKRWQLGRILHATQSCLPTPTWGREGALQNIYLCCPQWKTETSAMIRVKVWRQLCKLDHILWRGICIFLPSEDRVTTFSWAFHLLLMLSILDEGSSTLATPWHYVLDEKMVNLLDYVPLSTTVISTNALLPRTRYWPSKASEYFTVNF